MKINFKKSIVAAAVSAAVLSTPFAAHATNGYFSHGYGVKAKGMAGAGVALPQDALAAATNPAGMVRVGSRWDAGAEVFVPDRTATTAWGTAFNGTSTTYDGNGSGYGESWFLIPEFGYNKMVNKNMSWGVSVFGNGGMNTSYSSPIFSAGSTNENTGIDLMQLFISPTLSIRLDSKNTLGIAINMVYQRFKAEGMNNFGVSSNGYDSSTGVSFRIGWMGDLTNTLTAGFTYQPRTNMKPFDKYNTLFAEAGDFDIPANYALGLAWKATPKMTIALDVERINYEGIKSIANPNNFSVDGSATSAGFGWKNMTVYKLGANFQVNKDLVVRAGWNHGGQPIPQGETLFNVVAPATVEDHLTLGFTMNMNGGELSGFYMHAFDNDITGVPGGTATGGGASAPGAANIGMSQNAFGIAYGKKF